MTEEIKAKRDESWKKYFEKQMGTRIGMPIIDVKFSGGFDAGFAIGLERAEVNSIHTCHDECQRLPCVQRREIEALKEAAKVLVNALEFARTYKSDNEGFAGPSIELNEIRIASHEALKLYEEKVGEK